MTMTRLFSLGDQEPFPGLYARLARWPLFSGIYRLVTEDQAVAVPDQSRLLDVGTGPGYLLEFLARLRPDLRLVGLDLSYEMLRHGRRLAGFSSGRPFLAVVGKAQALPFASETFLHVSATFSLHHWHHPARGVMEIYRVLKPFGTAWIMELNPEADPTDIRRFADQFRLPWLPVVLGYKLTSWHSALKAADFAHIMDDAGISHWHLTQVYHLFWRLELIKIP